MISNRLLYFVVKPLSMLTLKVSVNHYHKCTLQIAKIFPSILANFQTYASTAQIIHKGNDTVKEQIISKMNFQTVQHAEPFYKLPVKTLLHIYKVTANDEKHGYCKNRLYYVSSKLKCPPSLLSKYVAERTFLYSLSFDWLEKSLNVLLEMGVSSDRIIRDLWVLKYKSDTIKERLERVKALGIDNLYPWMVRCSEDILNRYVAIYQETKNILGNNESTHIYLAKRLNTTVEAVEEMCIKTPALKTIRVTKVKHFLDYLISEGISPGDIAKIPRILSASQKTVKERIDKLRQLGFQELNLNVLCRSKKQFKKFCYAFESSSKSHY
ncbi:unnamed protein product [Diatraea saccharalis]|uniref:Transcription termination factor, mitochondrial n=1 Tax=Diatraea saccharalis TaxID=40085 RepID=A0A9N9QW59_9NEOP|nr:unnamed protein product [Diatraea saccharalis]